MDKTFLVQQLASKIRALLERTHDAAEDARVDAKTGAQRAVNLAHAQTQRELNARAALDAVESFRPKPLGRGDRIGLGAVVEVEGDEAAHTFFLAPTGAGEELTGPGGDGFFQVVTPASPFGRALMGKRVGDVVEVPLKGDVTEWNITFAG